MTLNKMTLLVSGCTKKFFLWNTWMDFFSYNGNKNFTKYLQLKQLSQLISYSNEVNKIVDEFFSQFYGVTSKCKQINKKNRE